ncbi:MAG: hypothetical protein J5746_10245, partial [Victivallales bacterium]|nr:hypothetical protein [Victivallales bacterium]
DTIRQQHTWHGFKEAVIDKETCNSFIINNIRQAMQCRQGNAGGKEDFREPIAFLSHGICKIRGADRCTDKKARAILHVLPQSKAWHGNAS